MRQDELEKLAAADMEALGKTREDFRFFLAFAGGVKDRYGRLLGFLDRDQPDTQAAQRLGSYNERRLGAGWVSPYFIWPNINPFRRAGSVTAAVPHPGGGGRARRGRFTVGTLAPRPRPHRGGPP